MKHDHSLSSSGDMHRLFSYDFEGNCFICHFFGKILAFNHHLDQKYLTKKVSAFVFE